VPQTNRHTHREYAELAHPEANRGVRPNTLHRFASKPFPATSAHRAFASGAVGGARRAAAQWRPAANLIHAAGAAVGMVLPRRPRRVPDFATG